MLFIVFRSAWLVVIGALPSAVALLVVLGLMGLAGVTLSAAATGACDDSSRIATVTTAVTT